MKIWMIKSANVQQRILFATIAVIAITLSSCSHGPAPMPKGDPDNGGIFLPDSFAALVVVDSIGEARHLAVKDNGDIYVKLTRNDRMKDGSGGTVGLRDLDGDGKADSIVYFGDYKDVGGSAVGMTIHDGYLWTSAVDKVYKTKIDDDLVPTAKTELVLTDVDSSVAHNWHTTKPLAFDKKGNMYVPFGTPSDAGQDITKYGPVGIPNGKGLQPPVDLANHGGIWKFDASKTNLFQKDGTRFSTGIRSVVGMTWNNADDNLYAVVNGIDNFHTIYPTVYSSWQAAVLPSELMIKATEGADFGWPYAYFDHMLQKTMKQPGYGGDSKIPADSGKYTMPAMGFPGHWAPMDIMFYTGDQFPERYKNGAFIAFHGSTDRSPFPQAGYIVVFVPFKDGKPYNEFEVFADGFTGVDTVVNTSQAVYRPMGLAQGPDGSLYISESNQGKIWRVMYKGDKSGFKDTQLAAMDKRKNSRSYIKPPNEKTDNLGTADRLEGSILYKTYCTSCHQGDGKGDGNRYPPLAESEIVRGDKNKVIDIILNGLTGDVVVNGKTYNGLMPAHGGFLDDHAVASIVTFIRGRRFQNEAGDVSTADVTAVRAATSKSKK